MFKDTQNIFLSKLFRFNGKLSCNPVARKLEKITFVHWILQFLEQRILAFALLKPNDYLPQYSSYVRWTEASEGTLCADTVKAVCLQLNKMFWFFSACVQKPAPLPNFCITMCPRDPLGTAKSSSLSWRVLAQCCVRASWGAAEMARRTKIPKQHSVLRFHPDHVSDQERREHLVKPALKCAFPLDKGEVHCLHEPQTRMSSIWTLMQGAEGL